MSADVPESSVRAQRTFLRLFLLALSGVAVGTLAALVAFDVNSTVGINARYPPNFLGLLVSVWFGFLISLITTGVGLLTGWASTVIWRGRTGLQVPGVVIGCLLGGLLGATFVRNGLASWVAAVVESEIVGVSEAIVLGIVMAALVINARRSRASAPA